MGRERQGKIRKRKEPDNAMKRSRERRSELVVSPRETNRRVNKTPLGVVPRIFPLTRELEDFESEGGDVKQGVARVLKKAVRTKRKRTTR